MGTVCIIKGLSFLISSFEKLTNIFQKLVVSKAREELGSLLSEAGSERGHPVRLSGLRTLADKDVRDPSPSKPPP
jgi:hypothetical protein